MPPERTVYRGAATIKFTIRLLVQLASQLALLKSGTVFSLHNNPTSICTRAQTVTQPITNGQPEFEQRAQRLHEMAVNLFSSSEAKGKDDALRAAKLLQDSVALHPTPQSLLNLSKLFMVAGLQETAIEWAEKCLDLSMILCKSNVDAAHSSAYAEVALASHRLLGQAHAHLAQYDRALPHLKQFHLGHPTDTANEFDLAYSLLALGQYEEGWSHYLVRYRPGFAVSGAKDLPKLPVLEWDGSNRALAGKSILLVPEQGFGDEIHFARVARNLRGLGARVWIMAQEPLRALMRTLPWKERVVGTEWNGFEEADLWTTALKAYALLGLNPYKEPACCPYLMPEPFRSAEIKQKIHKHSTATHTGRCIDGEATRLIGINWRGNAQHFNNEARSMSLEEFIAQVKADPTPQISKARLFSVQMAPSEQELRVLDAHGIQNLAPHIANFADLAAALSCLDHLFTVDSAPAHLAGALSIPTTLLVPPRIDWRWGTKEHRPPWYSSLQVKEQTRFK